MAVTVGSTSFTLRAQGDAAPFTRTKVKQIRVVCTGAGGTVTLDHRDTLLSQSFSTGDTLVLDFVDGAWMENLTATALPAGVLVHVDHY